MVASQLLLIALFVAWTLAPVFFRATRSASLPPLVRRRLGVHSSPWMPRGSTR